MNPRQLRNIIINRVSPDEFIDVLGITIEELVIKFKYELEDNAELFEDYLDTYEGVYDEETE